jgi:hypothetical protein
MADSPSSAEFEELTGRLFSFYPPILNIEHNEWQLKKAEWSEVLVENPKMDIELWVPRTWLGEISKVDEPHVIVGLKREVEYKGGALVPYHRKVVGMPQAHSAPPLPITAIPRRLTVAEEIRSPSGPETKLAKGLLITLAAALVLIVLAVGLSRLRSEGGTISFKAQDQRTLSLTADSTYIDVIQKLGAPEEDHWRPGGGERRYRALTYKKEGMIILLMGPEQDNGARYIGAKDLEWNTVHSVALPGGRSTDATLASLKRF